METVWIGVLGGLLALDATSVGQFMVSRPLVAGTVVGWALGDPILGATVGAMLELYLLVSFPTGGSRFPEGATATVVAVGSAAGSTSGGAFDGAVLVAMAVGLAWGQVGGASITWLRQLNGRRFPQGPLSPGRVTGYHLGAIGLDFVRGALVTVTGVLIGRMAVSGFSGGWPLSPSGSFGLVVVGGAVSLGILLRDMGGFRRHRWAVVAGLALGIVGASFL